MHAIVGVIHKKDIDVASLFHRYLYDNEDNLTENFYMSKEDALKEFQNEIDTLLEKTKELEEDSSIVDTLKEMKKLNTDKEKIEYYMNNCLYGKYFYSEKEGVVYELINEYGQCDWFVIGGRWNNSLYDFYGNGHNTISLREYNINNSNSLRCPYGYVLDYLDDYNMYIDVTEEEWNEELNKAKQYMEKIELEDDELYLTIVDMHM